MSKFKIDKTKLKDSMGRPLTQGLFLEIGYNTDFAVYSLDDFDKEYKGGVYPSLKRLFIEAEDVSEYNFSREHLLGWQHWQRLNANKMLREHFDKWREELSLAIRSEAIRSIMDQALEGTNFQAAKWLAEGGWDKRKAGRPSKAELEKEAAIHNRIQEEFKDDFDRLKNFRVVK